MLWRTKWSSKMVQDKIIQDMTEATLGLSLTYFYSSLVMVFGHSKPYVPESYNHYQQRLVLCVYPENLFTDLKPLLLTLFEVDTENIYSHPLYRFAFIFEDLTSHSSLMTSSLAVLPLTSSLICCSLCSFKLVDIFLEAQCLKNWTHHLPRSYFSESANTILR